MGCLSSPVFLESVTSRYITWLCVSEFSLHGELHVTAAAAAAAASAGANSPISLDAVMQHGRKRIH